MLCNVLISFTIINQDPINYPSLLIIVRWTEVVHRVDGWCLNRMKDHPLWGKSMTLRVDPMALAGRLVAKRARTAPLFPWLLEMRPQMV
jgi:hypothetical protein